jgi:hypothetical protein
MENKSGFFPNEVLLGQDSEGCCCLTMLPSKPPATRTPHSPSGPICRITRNKNRWIRRANAYVLRSSSAPKKLTEGATKIMLFRFVPKINPRNTCLTRLCRTV